MTNKHIDAVMEYMERKWEKCITKEDALREYNPRVFWMRMETSLRSIST